MKELITSIPFIFVFAGPKAGLAAASVALEGSSYSCARKAGQWLGQKFVTCEGQGDAVVP